MITIFPVDFNYLTYDIHTNDGTLWRIEDLGAKYQIVSGGKAFDLMKLDNRFTFFAPGYDNINVNGFHVDGVEYVIDAVVPNENYVPPPEPATTDDGDTVLQEFEGACQQFRYICSQIGAAIDNPNFRGGFDEMSVYGQSDFSNTLIGLKLAMAWNGANELCKYTSAKAGFGQPQWWYKCWETE